MVVSSLSVLYSWGERKGNQTQHWKTLCCSWPWQQIIGLKISNNNINIKKCGSVLVAESELLGEKSGKRLYDLLVCIDKEWKEWTIWHKIQSGCSKSRLFEGTTRSLLSVKSRMFTHNTGGLAVGEMIFKSLHNSRLKIQWLKCSTSSPGSCTCSHVPANKKRRRHAEKDEMLYSMEYRPLQSEWFWHKAYDEQIAWIQHRWILKPGFHRSHVISQYNVGYEGDVHFHVQPLKENQSGATHRAQTRKDWTLKAWKNIDRCFLSVIHCPYYYIIIIINNNFNLKKSTMKGSFGGTNLFHRCSVAINRSKWIKGWCIIL